MTRDEPDYGKLMDFRLDILRQHGLGLKEIQETIARIDPLPGARDFLDELRATTQAVIISDTFTQFAQPLMAKLGWPALFCNELEVADDGTIAGFRMRCPESKLTTVRALQSCGFDTIAAGDSHNDLGMIRASKGGLPVPQPRFHQGRTPTCAFEEYDDLLAAVKQAMACCVRRRLRHRRFRAGARRWRRATSPRRSPLPR